MNTIAVLLASLALAPANGTDPLQEQEVRWEPFTSNYRTRSGYVELTGRLGRITVPERRDIDTDKTIEIAFTYYETEDPEPGPPVVYLIGGPGGSGTEHGANFAMHPLMPVLEHHDVICLDQRGTGQSVPNLSEGPDLSYGLPLDRAATADDLAIVVEEAMALGHEYWTEQGVDLSAYNTRESAHDIDAVRRALGIDQVIPWGVSYGSHLGLAYVRLHPDSIARAVLMKVEGPNHTFKLPSTVQRHLDQLAEMVAADETMGALMPDMNETLKGILDQLEEEPVTVTVEREGAELEVTFGAFDVRRVLSNALSETRDIMQIPAAIYRMSQGDWSEMAEEALGARSGEVWSMMSVMMDCSSLGTAERMARIEREARDPEHLLSDAINVPLPPISCEALGGPDLGDEFRSPIESDVPVLFLSGSLDVRTPPENVEEIRGGFSNHAHVLVEGTGHDSMEILSDEYQELKWAFLRDGTLEDRTLRLPTLPLRFNPVGSR